MNTKKQIDYEASMKKLEAIVRKMENDELDIDELSVNLKQAQELIKACKDKLMTTQKEIDKLLKQ